MKRIVQIKEYDFDESIHFLKVALNFLQSMERKGEKVKEAESYLKMAIDRLNRTEN